MTPVGKGSRFRVTAGPHRGRDGVVVRGVRGRADWWTIDIGDGDLIEVAPHDISTFERLSDAPAEVDPLFAELAEAEMERSRISGGNSADDRRCPSNWVTFAVEELIRADSVIGEPDAGGDPVYRASMMRVALLALAAVRCIDRAHKPG